jgi:hypothetical protein
MIFLRDEWLPRTSRGGGISFYATKEEISQFIFDIFCNDKNRLDMDNFYVCGTDNVKIEGSRYYEQHAFSYNLRHLIKCINEHSTMNFCIGDRSITPIDELVALNDEWIMDLNGLIQLQYFSRPLEYRKSSLKAYPPSHISVLSKIDRIRRFGDTYKDIEYTGETYEHIKYVNIFKVLKREFRKRLLYKTRYLNTQIEDKGCFMSEGAVEMYKSGTIFEHEPLFD